MSKQQIGVVGMAVMGRNLALNIESRGYTVSVFNRSREKTEEVIAENPCKKLVPYYTVQEFVESLEAPRRIPLMVKARSGTDSAIDSPEALPRKGDIIIDGGNTFFRTPSVVIVSYLPKVLTLSVPVFPVVKRGSERAFHHARWAERSL